MIPSFLCRERGEDRALVESNRAAHAHGDHLAALHEAVEGPGRDAQDGGHFREREVAIGGLGGDFMLAY
ncbi:MAG: hypothetical protein JWM82_1833 [Myxococcales bacterium]|nr:hypothetical protein [Myxococcales bacterium]